MEILKKYGTIADLIQTTLEKAGLTSGNGVIRLLFKHTSLTMDQVKQDIEMSLQKLSIQSKDDPPPAPKPTEPRPVVATTSKAPAPKVVQQAPIVAKPEPTPPIPTKDEIPENIDREMHVYKPLPGDFSMARCKL